MRECAGVQSEDNLVRERPTVWLRVESGDALTPYGEGRTLTPAAAECASHHLHWPLRALCTKLDVGSRRVRTERFGLRRCLTRGDCRAPTVPSIVA